SEIQPLLEEFTEAWNAGSVGSRARVAACNQATAELNALMGFGVERRVRWRICLTVGVAGAAALIGVSASIAGVCLVCGAVSALLTWQIGRMADYRAQNLRAEWNGLIRRLRRSFPEK